MIRYALLGLLQGLTEFLPVSSSGHLVLARTVLGVESPGASLEAVVHLGTLCALLVYFRRDLSRLAVGLFRRGEERQSVGQLVLGTVPVVAAGLLARGAITRAFGAPVFVGAMLVLTALTLALADRRVRHGGRAGREDVTVCDAVAVGVAQAVALLPGISRSGATVAMGIGRGLHPSRAARFSFLLAIPAIAGACILALLDTAAAPGLDVGGLALAGGCALLSGLVAIRLLLRVVRAGILWPFAVYCGAVGLAVVVWG